MKSLFQNILLAIGAVFIVFGAAEALSRLAYQPRKFVYQTIFEYDKDKVFCLKARHRGSFAEKPVVTNALGYRDSEIPIEKNAGMVRILAAGDSVTFGHGVNAEETYPEQLESMLNQWFSSYRFDVINTAVPGNCYFQEYFDIERGIVFDPDIVMIQFVMNDVIEPFTFYKRYGGKGRDWHGVEDLNYWDWLLSQHSAFYLFMKDLYSRARFGAMNPEEVRKKAQERAALDWNAAAYEPKSAKVNEAWVECLRWLQKVADLCRKKNVPCVLIISPTNLEWCQPEARYAQRQLKAFARKNSIICVDILDRMSSEANAPSSADSRLNLSGTPANKTAPSNTELNRRWQDYFMDYCHYTPKGHRFVAANLCPVIVRILEEKQRLR